MEEKNPIEIARGVLINYHTTLNGIYAQSFYPRNSVEHKKLKEIIIGRLEKIAEAKSERGAAKEYFQYEISESELASLRNSIISEREMSGEEIRDIQKTALQIATLCESKKYMS